MFWRGMAGYLPANVISGIVGVATIATFTRLLTPAQFGAYALGFSLMTLVHTAVFTWNEAAMARFWAGAAEKGEARAHMATIWRTWAVLLAVLPLALGVVLLWPMGRDLELAAVAGLAMILPRTAAKLAQERRRAAGEVRSAALMDIVQSLGGFLVGALLALAGLGGSAPLFGAGVAAAVCAVVVLKPERALAAGGGFEPRRATGYAAYGIPVALSLILALVLSTTDRFLIAAFLDEAQVGVYHAGYGLANRALDVLFVWLGAAGGPALIMALERGGRPALADAAREQGSVMVLMTLPAAVGVALVARPLCELMVGPALREGAAQVTPWIAAGAFLAGINTYYLSQAFTLGRKTRLLLVAMAIPAAANVALNLILIPRLGLTGAMAATLASYALGAVASFLLGRKALSLPVPWRALVEAGLGCAVMAVAVLAVPSVGGVIELLLKAGVGALAYGLVIAALDAGSLRSRAALLLRARRGAAA